MFFCTILFDRFHSKNLLGHSGLFYRFFFENFNKRPLDLAFSDFNYFINKLVEEKIENKKFLNKIDEKVANSIFEYLIKFRELKDSLELLKKPIAIQEKHVCLAIEYGKMEILKYILEYSTEETIRSQHIQVAFDYAIKNKKFEFVGSLLDNYPHFNKLFFNKIQKSFDELIKKFHWFDVFCFISFFHTQKKTGKETAVNYTFLKKLTKYEIQDFLRYMKNEISSSLPLAEEVIQGILGDAGTADEVKREEPSYNFLVFKALKAPEHVVQPLLFLLKKAGLDLHGKNAAGKTPLHVAVELGQARLVRDL